MAMIRTAILSVLTVLSLGCDSPMTATNRSNEPTTTSSDQGDSAQQVIERLQGVWRGVSRQPENEHSDPTESTIFINGNNVSFLARDKETIEASFEIDAAASPMQIIWIHPADEPGQEPEKRTQIFKVEGDELTICSSDPGEAIPTDFSISQQNDWVLSLYRKKHR